MKILKTKSKVESRKSRAGLVFGLNIYLRPSTLDPRPVFAFTMMEIAISLAVIGIALVAIIGVLPLGMRTQRENREQTLINQDATILMEAIRNGAHGADDLTNYVLAITNTDAGASYSNPFLIPGGLNPILTNGETIIGLLSAPEFVDVKGYPVNAADAFSSNHMVAFVRSMSGLAVEKPPQDNPLLVGNSFSYGVGCENIQLYTPPIFSSGQTYNPQDKVSYFTNGINTYWQWQGASSISGVPPGASSSWIRDQFDEEMAANSHEMRLTFLWSLLPDSQPPGRIHYGGGRWTYRASVAGQLVDTSVTPNLYLYFFQPQSFATNAP